MPKRTRVFFGAMTFLEVFGSPGLAFFCFQRGVLDVFLGAKGSRMSRLHMCLSARVFFGGGLNMVGHYPK